MDSSRHYIRSLKLLLKASNIFAQSHNINELLEGVINQIFDLFKRIDRGAILLVDQETGRLKEVVSKTRLGKKQGLLSKFHYSKAIVKRTIDKGKAVMISDTSRVDKGDLCDSVEQMDIRSVMCVPLTFKGEVRGAIYVDSIGSPGGFRKDDLQLLTGLGDTAAIALQNAQLYEALKQELAERKQAEEALKASEKKYRILIENAQEGVWAIDAEARTTFVNQRMAEMLGYTVDEMVGMSLFSFMDNRSVEVAKRNFARRRQGIMEQHDFEFLRKDGTFVHTMLETSPIYDDDGYFVGALACVADITERKRAEDALKWELAINSALSKSYAPLISPSASIKDIANTALDSARSLTGSEHGYVSSIDPLTGDNVSHTLTEMLKGQCKVPGEKRKIVFPRGKDGLYSGLWGHCLNTLKAFFSNSPDTHEASAGLLEGHIPIRRFLAVPVMLGQELVGQIALANKDQDYTERDLQATCRLAEFYALAIQRKRAEDALRKAHHILERRVEERTAQLSKSNALLRKEIAERRQAEEAMRTSEAQKKAILDASVDRIRLVDKDMRIIWANKTSARELNRAPEDIVGEFCYRLLVGRDTPCLGCPTKKALESGQIEHAVMYQPYSKGIKGETYWDNYAVPIKNESDDIVSVIEIARNITERKQAEEALRRSEAELRRLSSKLLKAQEEERKRIALELHDSIAQGLVAIKFGLESKLNQMGENPAPPGISLETIIATVQNSIEETRRIMTNLRPSMLDDLGILATISWRCREVETIYSGIRIEKQIDIEEHDVPDSLKIVIYRVLQEALNNTARHSQAGLVSLSLRKIQGTLELALHDNGRGFDVDQVFGGELSGRGLGLGSMKDRTELSGGSFFIESHEGAGTTIRAVWPCD